MALFPRVQSPCPYKDRLASVMEGTHCRMCRRDVFDLTHLTDAGRREFIASCDGEICVSYRLRPALAAAAIAASVAALPAAAQDAAPAPADAVVYSGDAVTTDEEYESIIVGGIKDPKNTEWVEDAADVAIPELPVVEEPAKVSQPAS